MSSWPVDLTGPEAHLRESLVRALAALPRKPGTPPGPASMDIGEWREDERDVFCAAGCLLAEVWPQMLAEASAVVRQVALLAGRHIDGYTDFTTHGVVFINRHRLEPGRTGLPGSARLAEALVHEGTHNRFNVAALSRPFLIDEVGQGAPALLATPYGPIHVRCPGCSSSSSCWCAASACTTGSTVRRLRHLRAAGPGGEAGRAPRPGRSGVGDDPEPGRCADRLRAGPRDAGRGPAGPGAEHPRSVTANQFR